MNLITFLVAHNTLINRYNEHVDFGNFCYTALKGIASRMILDSFVKQMIDKFFNAAQ